MLGITLMTSEPNDMKITEPYRSLKNLISKQNNIPLITETSIYISSTKCLSDN